MDTYVVIQLKKKEEKVKILTFLAAETEAEYKVTMDLKVFVAEKFHVKIMEYVDMKDQATDTSERKAIDIVTIKDEVVNNIVDVDPVVDTPTIDNNMDALHGQHTDMADIQPSNDIDTQTHPSAVSQRELFNIGTYVPYRDRMVKPKQEVIDDVFRNMEEMEEGDNGLLMDMDTDNTLTTINEDIQLISTKGGSGRVTEEKDATKEIIAVNDAPSLSSRLGRTTKRPRYSMDDDDKDAPSVTVNHDMDTESIDDTLTPINKDIPSTSTKRRPGRSMKRINYSVDDDYVPETKKSNKATPKSTEGTKKGVTCQKCGSNAQGYVQKVEHVSCHANIMRYECMVGRCGQKSVYKGNIRCHMKTQHPNQLESYREVQFTSEDTEKLDKMMEECFSLTNEKKENNCQLCQQCSGGNGPNPLSVKRDHALHHLNFMIYKCTENGCQFESKTRRSMTIHRSGHETISRKSLIKIELTKEQEEEVEKMIVKCFPRFG